MTSTQGQQWTVTFTGRVQGVGFRHTVFEIAQRFSVVGYVKNQIDGSVVLVTEGQPNELAAFVDSILLARQRNIESHSANKSNDLDAFENFEIRR